ncbi:MAG: SpoIVB peptidase S55 domain-containing protein [Thermoanaerobaculia bacterium]
MRRIGFVLGILLLVGAVPRAAPASPPILEVSGIHAGQKGYGLCDFGNGKGVTRFGVEILGVMRDYAPKQDLILARLSGNNLEKSGVIAGMSGSPVYVDDRLVGAVAYGWPFSEEAIAGITPIESMLDIRHVPASAPVPIGAPSPAGARPTAAFLESFERGDFLPAFRALVDRVFPERRDGWAPLPLPLSHSGASDSLFRDTFLSRGAFLDAPSGSRARPAVSSEGGLKPGSSVSTILISGDMTMAATGTVTWVEGSNVLAFGHPFLSMGPVEMPMADSEVIGILPSLYRSFKFASTGRVLGSITQDRSTGILGSFGTEAKMVPVHVSIASENLPVQRFNFRVVRNSMLTPILAATAIDTTLSTLEKSVGERTIVWKSAIRTPGRTIRFDSVFSGMAAKDQAVSAMALLTNYLMANEFHDLAIDGIDVAIEHSDVLKNARITGVVATKDRVRPGETVPLFVSLQDFRGSTRRVALSLPVPAGTPPGPLTVFVGDGISATAFDLSLFPADPRSLEQVLDFLDRLKPANSVNLLAYRAGPGAMVSGEELPALPPSIYSLYSAQSARDGGPSLSQQRVYSSSVEQAIPVTGSVRLTLDVVAKID